MLKAQLFRGVLNIEKMRYINAIIIIYLTYWYLFMGVEMPYVTLNQLGCE